MVSLRKSEPAYLKVRAAAGWESLQVGAASVYNVKNRVVATVLGDILCGGVGDAAVGEHPVLVGIATYGSRSGP